MILKNLWYRKTRTLLTMLGIAVGVAAVVAFSAFGEGFANGFESVLSSSNADLTVAQKDSLMVLLSAVDESIGDELRQISGVEEVTGSVISILQMPEAPYFVVAGEDLRSNRIRHYKLVAGQPLAGKRQILLGKLAAKSLAKNVGDTFRFNDTSYRVTGIYETGIGLEDGGAVISLADAQRTFDKRDQVSYFNVNVKDARRIDEVKKAIEARWPDLAAMRSGEAATQTEMLNMTRSFGWFLGFFAVLVGGLGMMNTTLMSVSERTREIGVLRALGWRRRRIIGMILGESLVLALGGGLLGIALGAGLTFLTRLSPAVESLLQGILTPAIFIQAIIIALLLGTVGGLYPAWRAAKLAPIDAMRQESGVAIHWSWAARLAARLPGSSALRNLWRRPTRTLVTMAGIGLGVGFIVMLIAMSDGMAITFTQLTSAGQADLVAEQAKASDVSFSAIDERIVNQIRVQPEVKSVSTIIFGVSTSPGLTYFMILGLDPREEYIKHYRLQEGRLIARPREIMLGRMAAESLKKTVGDKVHIGGSSYSIVGIYENGLAYEDGSGVVVLKEAQRLFGKPRQVSMLGISIKDPAQAAQIARALEARFPEVMVCQAAALSERMQDFATMDALISAIVLLTMIVGGIVMMNAMLMSVFERTQEIGVLRALGWRRRRVLGMVLGESLALSLLSAILGTAIGVGLGRLVVLEPTMGYFLATVYSGRLFAQTLVFALVLGALGGIYPAWRATGLQPVEALRYE